MVRDAETYLAEMQECVKWYEAKVIEAEQRVTHLRGLVQQAQPFPEGIEDEITKHEE